MRAAFLCLVLSACSLGRESEDTPNKAAIADAYLIAHGMAVSYSLQLGADPTVTAQLARLDTQARRALLNDIGVRGGGVFRPSMDWDDSARAVAALSDYASGLTEHSR